ncbi:hypothetical protein PS627_03034 [Pseudomonas fluorescens]|uniref:DUF6515 family protein n=1 Tax=Pseudomonas fluorescens TaxID=294 RepID=UPI00125693C2|nr:DUF6515 family protein [Pseudomonas fluorescens]CAG8868456.1 hypothetical protein PS627_03034 [Pseudomonas fluorescens]
MKSRIWQLAGVGLLSLGVSCSASAQGPSEGHGGQGPQDPNSGGRGSSPLNSRDEVRQTQPPRQGNYQDIPRRPDGHGNGWGPGPQYRPGHTIDRFPDRYSKVPYRGQDYFYSGGYWYRPQGPNYVVVTPPYGARIDSLPSYAREVWVGNALFFLAADIYYQYLSDSREYVVVNPPEAPPAQQAGSGYDVIAYPAHGQTAEQQQQDRYPCHRWAVDQSGFDPASATYAPAANVSDTYRRALGACLSGRGYSVN